MCCAHEKLDKLSPIYATLFLREFLVFIFVRLVMYTTFSMIFFFCATFFNLRPMKQRKLLIGNEWEFRSKHGSYGKFLLADINKLLSSRHFYKLVVQNKVRIIFNQIIICLVLQFSFFSLLFTFEDFPNVISWYDSRT